MKKSKLLKHIFQEAPLEKNPFFKNIKKEPVLSFPLTSSEDDDDNDENPLEPVKHHLDKYENAKAILSSFRNKQNPKTLVELKKRRNLLKKQIRQRESDEIESLFGAKLETINSENEWQKEMAELGKMIRGEKIKKEKSVYGKKNSKYNKSLRTIIKKFFTIGAKIPKRKIYLPLTRTVNFSQIEQLNKKNYFDIVLKTKNAKFLDLSFIDTDVINYLEDNGYKVTKENYFKNLCVNKNNKIVSIDMELKKIQEIDIEKKKKFLLKNKDEKLAILANEDIKKREEYRSEFLERIENIKSYLNIMLDKMIVLTWSPLSILSQSTGTQWKSCMTFFKNPDDEVNTHYVGPGMINGVFIAWLIDINDKKISKPLARCLIKPRVAKINSQNEVVVWWPSYIYTTGGQKNIIDLFSRTLTNYMIYKQNNVFKNKKIEVTSKLYNRAKDEHIYPDDEEEAVIVNYKNRMEDIKQKEMNYASEKTGENDQYQAWMDILVDKYDAIFDAYDFENKNIKDVIDNTRYLEILKNNLSTDKFLNSTNDRKGSNMVIKILEKISSYNDYKSLTYLFSKLTEKEIDSFVFKSFYYNQHDQSSPSFYEILHTDTFLNYYLNNYFFKRLKEREDFLKKCLKYSRFAIRLFNFKKGKSKEIAYKLFKINPEFLRLANLSDIFKDIFDFDLFKMFFEISKDSLDRNDIKNLSERILSKKDNQEIKKQYLRLVYLENGKKFSISEVSDIIHHVLVLKDYELIEKAFFGVEKDGKISELECSKIANFLLNIKTQEEYEKYKKLFMNSRMTKEIQRFINNKYYFFLGNKKDKSFFNMEYETMLEERISKANERKEEMREYLNIKNFSQALMNSDFFLKPENTFSEENLDKILKMINKETLKNKMLLSASDDGDEWYIFIVNSIHSFLRMIPPITDQKIKNNVKKIINHFLKIDSDVILTNYYYDLLKFDINLLDKMLPEVTHMFFYDFIDKTIDDQEKNDFLKSLLDGKTIFNFKNNEKNFHFQGQQANVFYYFMALKEKGIFKNIKLELDTSNINLVIGENYNTTSILKKFNIKEDDFIKMLKTLETNIPEYGFTFDFKIYKLFSNKQSLKVQEYMINRVFKEQENTKAKFLKQLLQNNYRDFANCTETEKTETISSINQMIKKLDINEEEILNFFNDLSVINGFGVYLTLYSNFFFDIFLKSKFEEMISKSLRNGSFDLPIFSLAIKVLKSGKDFDKDKIISDMITHSSYETNKNSYQVFMKRLKTDDRNYMENLFSNFKK